MSALTKTGEWTAHSLALMFLVGFTFAVLLAGGGENVRADTDHGVLAEDEYMEYTMRGWGKGDTLKVSLSISRGEPGDIYIISASQYSHYEYGEDFTATVMRENISSAAFEWTKPNSTKYYIVVDNADNGHDSDALPNGQMSFFIILTIQEAEEIEEPTDWRALLPCLGIVPIVVVIILFYNWWENRTGPAAGGGPGALPGPGQPPPQYPPSEPGPPTYPPPQPTMGNQPYQPQAQTSQAPWTVQQPATTHACPLCQGQFTAVLTGQVQALECPHCGGTVEVST